MLYKKGTYKKGDEMEIILCGAILVGIIIAIVEMAAVHSDEPGGIGIQHALATFIPTMVMTFAAMNAGLVLGLLKLTESLTWDLIVRGGIALIAIIWITAKASIGRGVGEKLPHSLAVAALIFGSYYIWIYVLKGIVGGFLPC
jgi:hypothetical protein